MTASPLSLPTTMEPLGPLSFTPSHPGLQLLQFLPHYVPPSVHKTTQKEADSPLNLATLSPFVLPQ